MDEFIYLKRKKNTFHIVVNVLASHANSWMQSLIVTLVAFGSFIHPCIVCGIEKKAAIGFAWEVCISIIIWIRTIQYFHLIEGILILNQWLHRKFYFIIIGYNVCEFRSSQFSEMFLQNNLPKKRIKTRFERTKKLSLSS